MRAMGPGLLGASASLWPLGRAIDSSGMTGAYWLGRGFASCDWMEDVELEGEDDAVLFGCNGPLDPLGPALIVAHNGCVLGFRMQAAEGRGSRVEVRSGGQMPCPHAWVTSAQEDDQTTATLGEP